MIATRPIGIRLLSSSYCYLCAPTGTSTTSSSSTLPSSFQRSSHIHQRPQRRAHLRAYANVAGDNTDSLDWPRTAQPGAIPTPYEIFNQRKGSPYSKRRFYELVKLYHPDRNGTNSDLPRVAHLSQAVRLERYRLIIAANDILSDPAKRTAYDRYGAGWDGRPEVKVHGKHEPDWRSGTWTRAEHQSPFQNATWEDWERWYRRDRKAPQRPVFVTNGVFSCLILVLATIGGVTEAIRARKHSMNFNQQRDRAHNRSSRELRRRREEADAASGGVDGRIQSFLATRDPNEFGITDPEEEAYRRLLPDPEVCSSDDIKDRMLGVYNQDSKSGR